MTIESSLDRIANLLEQILHQHPQQLELNFGDTITKVDTTNPIVENNSDTPAQNTAHNNDTPAQNNAHNNDTDPNNSYSEDDVVAALEQFLPDRRDEAWEILQTLGVTKVKDVQPENYAQLIDQLNAKFNS